MSPSKYIQEAVRNYKEYIAKHLSKGYNIPKRAKNPLMAIALKWMYPWYWDQTMHIIISP